MAWLRDPDSLDMRCSFVTDSKEARDVQHLEQISPAPDYKSKGYHFLLNRVSKLWVVDTDYKSWAMLYTCSPHFGTTSQQVRATSRTGEASWPGGSPFRPCVRHATPTADPLSLSLCLSSSSFRERRSSSAGKRPSTSLR